MDLSFQEKSLWWLGICLVLAFGAYFTQLFSGTPVTMAADVMPHQIVLFVAAVGLLVLLSVVGQVLLALADRRTDTDERDRLIALKGTRNGACVLVTGVFCALCAAVLVEGNFLFTHLLLAFWLLAQLVEIGSQLVMYRRGA